MKWGYFGLWVRCRGWAFCGAFETLEAAKAEGLRVWVEGKGFPATSVQVLDPDGVTVYQVAQGDLFAAAGGAWA